MFPMPRMPHEMCPTNLNRGTMQMHTILHGHLKSTPSLTILMTRYLTRFVRNCNTTVRAGCYSLLLRHLITRTTDLLLGILHWGIACAISRAAMIGVSKGKPKEKHAMAILFEMPRVKLLQLIIREGVALLRRRAMPSTSGSAMSKMTQRSGARKLGSTMEFDWFNFYVGCGHEDERDRV